MKQLETLGRRIGGMFLVLQLLVLPAMGQITPVPAITAARAETHKLQISDPTLARQIEAQGGRLIGDYGSYRLYETTNASSSLLANPRAEIRDGYNVIQLHAGHLDTRKSETHALHQSLASFTGKRMHLVQFAGPVQAQWREELLAAGVQIISYIPENTYLVYGDIQSLARVQGIASSRPHIQWDGSYRNEYKIHPTAKSVDARGVPRAIGTDLFEIQLVADAKANPATLLLLNQLKLEPFKRQAKSAPYLNLIVRLDPKSVDLISAQPDVVAILPYFKPQQLCERQDQIIAGNLTGSSPSGPGYLAWLAQKGFTQEQFDASGIVVDISDSGVDNGTTLPGHFGLFTGGDVSNASRVVYARYEQTTTYPVNSLQGCDGHGNINAHIVGGYDDFTGFPFTDAAGFHFGLGVCPFVKLGSSVLFDSAYGDNFYYPDYNDTQADAYHDGVRISNNSWGGTGSKGVYNSESQNFDALVRDAQPDSSTYPTDGNQEMVIVFSAGNDGSTSQTVDSPGTAKNVITVGAAENVQLFGGRDINSLIPDSQANNANDIAPFSSRGPCADGRIKPDIVAPGTHVSGGVFQETNDFINFPTGIAGECFTGNEVSGGPTSVYWPSNQQFYTASSGTSHSAPAVAGGCALILQYFINNWGHLPSPAMTKAYLLNSCRFLTGVAANDNLPSNKQGMGEMNLGTAFDGTPRILSDQESSVMFTNSGQIRAITGTIADTNKPFRVTLAWTDAPGSLSGSAYNNNLDLIVSLGGNSYKGNVFNKSVSITGGVADAKNNVESVFLPAGLGGSFVVTINATSINSIGVPNTNNAVNQDYALVIYNANATPLPVAITAGTTLVSEGCSPTNGVIDPDETVTVNFALQNIGTADFTNLTATLQTDSNIISLSPPQAYGALTVSNGSASMPFTFMANGACGGTVTATLHLQDGLVDLGTVSYTLPLGKLIITNVLAQNFDAVTPTALPDGWTTFATGALSAWFTTNDVFDTPSNSIYVGEPDLPGTSTLQSPPVPITTPFAQLSFMNNYDLEGFPSNSFAPAAAFDGGVLEIQMDNGNFNDILTAGGSFVTNGYTAIVPGDDDSPFDGRATWSGLSGGFIPTIIKLPANAAGHMITLRWILGTDSGNAYGGNGWHIDSVILQDGYYQCCSPLVAPVILNPHLNGADIVFSFQSTAGQNYTVQYKNDLSDPDWTLLQSLTGDGMEKQITDDSTFPQRFYRVTSP